MLFLNMKLWLIVFIIDDVIVMLCIFCILERELFFYEEVGLENV